MARTRQLRLLMRPVSQANDARDRPIGEQSTNEDTVASRSVAEKVMAGDGTVENGKSIVQGQFYGANSCRNNFPSFLAIDIGSHSLPS